MKNKINVNISPNPLDLQTLHCSQNDTEERKFYFTLHNNGEVIDTSDISDPIFEPFSVYKGGTEQLLPVNTDDPTTSPIIADIQYPDEEKTEQEFTYRESPTTLDGNAIIEKLYGNTLVWNQLVENGNFADTSNWVALGTTYTVANNVATVVPSANGGSRGLTIQNIDIKKNHHYLIRYYNRPSKEVSSRAYFYSTSTSTVSSVLSTTCLVNTKTLCEGIITPTVDSNVFYLLPCQNGAPLTTDTYEMSEVNIFDLTAMFGSTKADEIYAMEQSESGSGVAYFRSLFPLNYYSYGQKLLPFNGAGIKTVGFNRFPTPPKFANNSTVLDTSTAVRVSKDVEYQFTFSSIGTATSWRFGVKVWKLDGTLVSGGTYTDVFTAQGGSSYVWNTGNNSYYNGTNTTAKSIKYTFKDDYYVLIMFGSGDTTSSMDMVDACFHESGYRDGEYEPYKSSTTSLPTLTYFPTGMKSAGTVYDELTNSKAITRVGEVDLGSLTWTYTNVAGHLRFVSSSMTPEAKTPNVIANAICQKYDIVTEGDVYNNTKVGLCMITNSRAMVYDPNYTDAQTFTTAMDGIYLQYELATEDETQFTQASLICEDGESTLYQDVDSLVCDCTEDFSKNSGFKDCKIKFTNDDGVVYSNKIQLHIERKP